MPDIRLTRIDNRLIHGQVATQWCGVVGANLLLVANDAVAKDELRRPMRRRGSSPWRKQSISSTRLLRISILQLSVRHLRMCLSW